MTAERKAELAALTARKRSPEGRAALAAKSAAHDQAVGELLVKQGEAAAAKQAWSLRHRGWSGAAW